MNKSILALITCTVLAGCSSQTELKNELTQSGCHYFGAPLEVAPDWVCSAKINGIDSPYTAVGVSENSAGGVSHQRNLAILDAQQLIGKQLESDVAQLTHKKLATLGAEGKNGATGATSEETVMRTDITLKELDVVRAQKGPDGFMYVLVTLPEQALENNIENMLTTDNDAELAREISAVLTDN